MPFEGLSNKLIKIINDRVHISWKSSNGSYKDDISLDQFQKNNKVILQPIDEAEYNRLFAEIFPQYIEEK